MASYAPPPSTRPVRPGGMRNLNPGGTVGPRNLRPGVPPPTRGIGGGGNMPPTTAGRTMNPYRRPPAITPELLAMMARRRLGG